MAAQTITHRVAALGLALVLAVAARPAAAADLLSGDWVGSYTCYQGPTALTLRMQRNGTQWVGTFEFGPLKTNKTVPHGSYTITAAQDGDQYDIVPAAWVDQPVGYVSVALDGTMSADLTTLSGNVLYDGCQTFKVSRTTPLPAPPAPKKKVGS